jgi:hypothetical protein
MTTTPSPTDTGSTVTAWKGMDKNLQCLGFQFEVGKTYTHEGSVAACSSGFHACRNPMDVWSYYPLGDGNRFFRVQLSGKTSEHDGDTKIAAETIYVETEVTLGEMIKAGVKHTIDAALKEAKDERFQAASGYYSRLVASGDSSQLVASGDYSQLAASGYSSRLAASGHSSQLAASGDYSRLAASGYYSQLAASGYSSRLAASGHSSQLAASGDYSQLAASGYSSRLAASGYSSRLAASGDSSQLAASGQNSVIVASAPACTAKGAEGTWIALAEFKDGKCIGFATGCIGKDGLLPDTDYFANGGKLVAA